MNTPVIEELHPELRSQQVQGEYSTFRLRFRVRLKLRESHLAGALLSGRRILQLFFKDEGWWSKKGDNSITDPFHLLWGPWGYVMVMMQFDVGTSVGGRQKCQDLLTDQSHRVYQVWNGIRADEVSKFWCSHVTYVTSQDSVWAAEREIPTETEVHFNKI